MLDKTYLKQRTQSHIRDVQELLEDFESLLHLRGHYHDESKLEEPELSGYGSLHEEIKDLPTGSPAYQAVIEKHKPAVEHHYQNNSHHPQHFPNGVNGMSLLDVIEMLCDWKASITAVGKDFATELELNFKRFGIDWQLQDIMRNTCQELGWGIVSADHSAENIALKEFALWLGKDYDSVKMDVVDVLDLAESYGKSTRTIRRYLQQLKEKGLLNETIDNDIFVSFFR